MNRQLLRKLTADRLLDAKALRDAGRWAFAYYVAGYAVECALKSCVLTQMVETGKVFTDKDVSKNCLTHNFATLVESAGLTDALRAAQQSSAAGGPPGPAFAALWNVVTKWKETSRYEDKGEAEANELIDAVERDPDGVLKWLQNFW